MQELVCNNMQIKINPATIYFTQKNLDKEISGQQKLSRRFISTERPLICQSHSHYSVAEYQHAQFTIGNDGFCQLFFSSPRKSFEEFKLFDSWLDRKIKRKTIFDKLFKVTVCGEECLKTVKRLTCLDSTYISS
jgi:hypothetical protein